VIGGAAVPAQALALARTVQIRDEALMHQGRIDRDGQAVTATPFDHRDVDG
jgi:hypothetical protein